jgi:deoxyribodipyrimidine photolyase-related protein
VEARPTVWILGDQLHRDVASLAGATPATARILIVESRAKLAAKRWHRQRLHLVLAGLRRFAAALRQEGFDVDHRVADDFAAGLAAHRRAYAPPAVRVMEPMSWRMERTLRRLDVALVRSNQFLCHRDDFAAWAAGRPTLRMEDFHRWQRQRLGILLDADGGPAGGRWNFDAENRERPPRGRRRRSRRSTTWTAPYWRTSRRTSSARRPTARGRRRARRRCAASSTSSRTGCRASARTRTP